jgi:phosphoribosylanthranilate isomerase
MFRVKVCGITTWTDASCAIDCGADALGFNFYPRSPRYISPRAAGRIIARLPKHVARVGVFVNEPIEVVLRARIVAGINLAQLHGEELPDLVARVAERLVTIKAFRVSPKFRLAELGRFKAADAYLLDGYSPRARGGTGRVVDWRLIRRARRFGPIILAGGLNAENVAEAVRRGGPAAVDVNSGVESAPGRKDPKKLRAFFEALETVKDFFS